MALTIAIAIGILTACGCWLLLRARGFSVILGLCLLSYAVNLLLLAAGRLRGLLPPILGEHGASAASYADPVPQALVLTAIVISFATTALLLVVVLATRGLSGSDRVDSDGDEQP